MKYVIDILIQKVGLYLFHYDCKDTKIIMIKFVGFILQMRICGKNFIHIHNFFHGLSPCHSFQESYLESHTAKKKKSSVKQ